MESGTTRFWLGGVEMHKTFSFKGQYYTSIHDKQNGASVWVSNDKGITWTQIPSAAFGFGIGATEEEAYHLYVYDDTLFVGTLNATFGGGIWFTQNGLDWYLIGTPGMGHPVAPHGSTVSAPNMWHHCTSCIHCTHCTQCSRRWWRTMLQRCNDNPTRWRHPVLNHAAM
jgi:hypothetical protein